MYCMPVSSTSHQNDRLSGDEVSGTDDSPLASLFRKRGIIIILLFNSVRYSVPTLSVRLLGKVSLSEAGSAI